MVLLTVGILAEENIKIEITPHINGTSYKTARMIVSEGVPAGFKIGSIIDLKFTPQLTSNQTIFISITGEVSAEGVEPVEIAPSLEVIQNEAASLKFQASGAVVVQLDIVASTIVIANE